MSHKVAFNESSKAVLAIL